MTSSRSGTPRQPSRVWVLGIIVALLAAWLPTPRAQATLPQIGKLVVLSATCSPAAVPASTIALQAVDEGANLVNLTQYPVEIDGVTATVYASTLEGVYGVDGVAAGDRSLTVPGYLNGSVPFTVDECPPSTATVSSVKGSTPADDGSVTLLVTNKSWKAGLFTGHVQEVPGKTGSVPLNSGEAGMLTINNLGAGTYTVTVTGQFGERIDVGSVVIPLVGSTSPSPTPTSSGSPTPTISLTPTPEPTAPELVFKPTASLSSSCLFQAGMGWARVFKATYGNAEGTAPGTFYRTVSTYSGEPESVAVKAGETLPREYSYANNGEYDNVSMSVSASGMSTKTISASVATCKTPKLVGKKFSGGKPKITVLSSQAGKICTRYNPPGRKGWTHYSCTSVGGTATAVNHTVTVNKKFHNYRHNKKIKVRVRFYYGPGVAAGSAYWHFNMWR